VEKIAREHRRVTVTRNGRAAIVLISIDDFEGLEETLELLSDPKALRELRKSTELEEGKGIPLEQAFPRDRPKRR
jgi:antitoxin YefM